MAQPDPGPAHRGPRRADTFDLRDQLLPDEAPHHVHPHADGNYASDEEHSVLDDDSSIEGDTGEYMDDDESSELSIPNESIDFDLVYSLTNFAATVEGQASVVKGDSLFLMDDSNSYWWLVRVLKTQEVGYIPAENIETPFERLARLNKHRNVDLASATQGELLEGANQSRENLRLQMSSRTGSNAPSPTPGARATSRARRARSVNFTGSSMVFRYPPAVWNEDEEGDDEWEDDEVEYADAPMNDEPEDPRERERDDELEPDDGMRWDGGGAEEIQLQMQRHTQALAQRQAAGLLPVAGRADTPLALAQSPPPGDAPTPPPLQLQPEPQGAGPAAVAPLRQQTSRERLLAAPAPEGDAERAPGQAAGASPTSPAARAALVDPAQVTDTKRVTVTPPVARDTPAPAAAAAPGGPLLPSAILEQQQRQQEQDRKRAREEIEAAEEAARKRANKGREKEIVRTASTETRSSTSSENNKLRKERHVEEEGAKDKKKKNGGGVFSGLFGRRKDKGKEKGGSSDNIAADAVRGSEDSGRSSAYSQYTAVPSESTPLISSPTTTQVLRQQPQAGISRVSPDTKLAAAAASPPLQLAPQSLFPQAASPQPGQQPPAAPPQVSQHASVLRERDQQQQALYQQYLKRSPSSPPEQPSYGLQSAPAIMPGSGSLSSASGLSLGLPASSGPFRTHGGRPGSLILSPTGPDGHGVPVPELSVIRVFAGENLQSDATFKTVLLNASTSAAELVGQAMQRFRLGAGEDAADYYLTVKQVEGSSAVLRAEEKPLGVFEQLVEAAMDLPKVKRSSMGSISSVASNLSAHPAIRKLPMNDFTDDSAFKFYLNRRGGEENADNDVFVEDEDTILAGTAEGEEGDVPVTRPSRNQFLTVNVSGGANVSPDRFSSPSYRFALQLVIYPDELPDDMVFDPHTEAIVFKDTLRDRSQSSAGASPGVSQIQRKKVFVFPKNITVAEVIELGLERFGILEGVVDGGDEVEDKLTKRRSSSRVRYSLTVLVEGQERELPPTSKVIDAFPHPPAFRRSKEIKRRSIDSAQLLGTQDDVQSDDPVFVLRRAVTYRSSGSSRHRLSAPLDEIALSHLHRESASSMASDTSTISAADEVSPRQPSRQEIIAAQRAASRANQKAILSTQANSHRGVDVILPGRAMLRSQRYDVDDRMRYSYVQPDGETYDISDIIEEEFKGEAGPQREAAYAPGDLLQGVVNAAQPGIGARLIDRVLNKINGKNAGQLSQSTSAATVSSTAPTFRSTSPSVYSVNEQDGGRAGSRSVTPTAAATVRAVSPAGSAQPKPDVSAAGFDATSGRPRSATPPLIPTIASHRQQQPSFASVLSDMSVYRTATPSSLRATSVTPSRAPAGPQQKRPFVPKNDFGLSEMLSIIEVRANAQRPPRPRPLDEVDELLFGPDLDVKSLHPQIREVYGDTFKRLEEMDAALDDLLQKTMHLF